MQYRSAFLVGVLLFVAACGGSTVTETTVASAAGSAPTLALPPANFTQASPHQAADIIASRLGSDGFVLLDVRTPEEFTEGRIAGSENIDFYSAAFGDNIAALDRNASYVVYCRSGNRSNQTIELMSQLGFTDVTEVSGGIVAWQAAGLPTE